MEIYLVGGAVRDIVMGLKPKDADFVVVGSTPEEMLRHGFKQVGKDFPVFLDPSGQEYSLARTERSGGVAVFGKHVTLQQDLAKRDLTINAMAYLPGSPNIIDPHGGQKDVGNKVLRMVSVESFCEDPIRVLRVARFAARYPDFTIDQATMDVMAMLSVCGKLDDLQPERVWKELSRGLMENKPSRMLQVLRQCGALEAILPELDKLYGVPQPAAHHPEIDTGIHIEQVIDYAASQDYTLDIRFAAMMHDLGKGRTPKENWPSHFAHEEMGVKPVTAVCERLRVPGDCMDLAILATREHGRIHGALKMKTTSIVRTLRQCDAFRRPGRFSKLLNVAICDARGREGNGVSFRDVEYPQQWRWNQALYAASRINTGEIAAQYQDRVEYIQTAIHAARARAIRAHEKANPSKSA